MFKLTQEDFAKNLLDKEAIDFIKRENVIAEDAGISNPLRRVDLGQHMYNPREQERWDSGRTIEEGLGGPVGDQAFLGGAIDWMKKKYQENQNWEPTYPTQPENLYQRDLRKKYPDLRPEPQEFSKTDVNKKVAEIVGKTAIGVAAAHPEWVGLDNDYISGGTKGKERPEFAQQIFERPDADKNLSDEEFTDLLKRELNQGQDLQPLGSGGGGQYPKWQTFYNPNTGNIHTNTEGYGTTITKPDGFQRMSDW